jgi:peptidoglycan/xylan/chitin deacetylase (PgdA/CDA1 family)
MRITAIIPKVAKRIARRIIGRPLLGRSILIYHRIAKSDFDPWNIAVLPDEFERQLVSLRRKTVLPLQEFVKLHIAKKLPPNSVAITFDDGYACNALVAAPMLASFGYPATFFIVSDAMARPDEFWWDQLEAIFHSPEFDYGVATHLLARFSVHGVGVTKQRNDVPLNRFLTIWDFVRRLSTTERHKYLDELRQRLRLKKETRATHRPMTEMELRALAANPLFEIGGHTMTHPSLPTLTAAEQEREIVAGAKSLEHLLGKPIRSFSYPFGDWQPGTRDIVKTAGFECAFVTEHRRVRPSDNQFELPRRQVVNRNANT